MRGSIGESGGKRFRKEMIVIPGLQASGGRISGRTPPELPRNLPEGFRKYRGRLPETLPEVRALTFRRCSRKDFRKEGTGNPTARVQPPGRVEGLLQPSLHLLQRRLRRGQRQRLRYVNDAHTDLGEERARQGVERRGSQRRAVPVVRWRRRTFDLAPRGERQQRGALIVDIRAS